MTLVDEESELKDSEPDRKRQKTEDDSLGKSVVPDAPEGKVKMKFFPYIYEMKIQHPNKCSVVLCEQLCSYVCYS
jgi:hypothetical protein